MSDLPELLRKVSSLHDHLCPRQVLGVRSGMLAAKHFGLQFPQSGKRLFAFVETDGCYADGISVATGCWLGHRTLRLLDVGKVACTIVDTESGEALRITPQASARYEALEQCPGASDRWHAQLEAYQTMPDDLLFEARPVTLTLSLEAIISKPGLRVVCDRCGEEIMNAREVRQYDMVLCRYCAGIDSYYCLDLSGQPTSSMPSCHTLPEDRE